MARGARRRAGGRAGSAGGRFGRYGGITAAVPFSFVFRRVRLTCERGGHRGRAEGAGARQRNGRDARRTMRGRQVGGLAVAGRSGGAAPFWSASRLVRFVQLADLASYTQAQGGRADRRACRRTAVCDAASPGSNRACWPIQERRWLGGAASAAGPYGKKGGKGKGRREARHRNAKVGAILASPMSRFTHDGFSAL